MNSGSCTMNHDKHQYHLVTRIFTETYFKIIISACWRLNTKLHCPFFFKLFMKKTPLTKHKDSKLRTKHMAQYRRLAFRVLNNVCHYFIPFLYKLYYFNELCSCREDSLALDDQIILIFFKGQNETI